MARYFFDFNDGDYETRDPEGHSLPGAEAARDEVRRALVEILAHDPRDTDHRRVTCSVRDAQGTVVYRGSLTLEGTLFPNDGSA